MIKLMLPLTCEQLKHLLKYGSNNELQPFFIWKMCVFFDKIWREKKIAAGKTINKFHVNTRDRRDRDRMVVGFTTTCAISAYHN